MLLLPHPALLPAALSELIALDRSCVLHQDPHCRAATRGNRLKSPGQAPPGLFKGGDIKALGRKEQEMWGEHKSWGDA